MMLTSKNLVAFASIAIATVAFLFAGCTRDEEPRKAPDTPAGEVREIERLKDPAYKAALDARFEAQSELMRTRSRLVARMETMIADAKARLGTADESVLKVELEKDSEWNSLYSRVTDLDKALGDEHNRVAEIIRRRMAADIRKESAAQ